MDVVNVLSVPAALECRMEYHHAAAVHDEADLPPEGAIVTLGEVGQNLHEEILGEGDIVDGFERRMRPPGLRHRNGQYCPRVRVVGGGRDVEIEIGL